MSNNSWKQYGGIAEKEITQFLKTKSKNSGRRTTAKKK